MIQAEGVRYDLSLNGAGFQSGINSAMGSVSKLEGAISGLGAAIGVTFGLAAITAFGSKMIEAGTTVENAKIGLTTLMGSAAGAASVIKNTLEDATKTPFAFEGLLAANKALISAGADSKEARDNVLNLSNAIAATGGGDDELQRMVINLQQIKNTGQATTMDIKQFAFAGINIYSALEAAGIKYAKGQELTYEQVTKALQVAHDQGGIYFNGLENMQDSVSVKLSNVKDSVFRLAVEMFDNLRPAIISVTSGLQTALTWIENNTDTIKDLALVVGIAAGAWYGYQIATNAAAIAQTALNVAMSLNPIGLLITGLALLTGALVVAWHESLTFRATLTGLWGVIKEFGSTTANIFGGLAKQIRGIFTFNPADVSQGFEQMTTAMFGAGQRMRSAYQSGFQSAVEDEKKDERARFNDWKVNKALSQKAFGGKKSAMSDAASKPGKSSTRTEAQGSKVLTINVSVNNLVKEFTVQTTNIKEGANKLQEIVTSALKNALNDSQIAIGQ